MDDEEDFTNLDDVNKNNFEQIKNKAIKLGFGDGVSDGRERLFQQGFDQGYRDGLTASFDLEKFRFFFNHLNTDKINNKDLLAEKGAYQRISPMDLKSHILKDNSFCKDDQKRVEDTLKTFAQKMPVATSLLNVQSSTL